MPHVENLIVGESKTFWWILGVFTSILLALASLIFLNLSARVAKDAIDIETLRVVQQSRGERVARIEAQMMSVQAQLDALVRDMDYAKRRFDALPTKGAQSQ